MNNLQGQRFGKLKVMSENGRTSYQQVKWLCKCDCGNFTIVVATSLIQGLTKSCGCLRKMLASRNLLRQKFNQLLVIQKLERRNGSNIIWGCACNCGNYCEVSGSNLVRNHTKSCGCLVSKTNIKRLTTHGQTGTKQYANFKEAKRRASKLNRTPLWLTEWDKQMIKEIYLYCPDNFEVDHIIPLQGELVSGFHTPDNLQYLYKPLNRIKHNNFKPQYTVNP